MLFDPDTGKLIDPDALKSVQFNSRGARVPRSIVKDDKKFTQRLDERTGEFKKGSYNVEHPSGKVDQHVTVFKGKQREPEKTNARAIAQG